MSAQTAPSASTPISVTDVFATAPFGIATSTDDGACGAGKSSVGKDGHAPDVPDVVTVFSVFGQVFLSRDADE